MIKFLGKWLKVYEDEIGLFLYSALLLFLIRNSTILFNNFAETAFLKRYGVEYLPIVYVVNSISTFFIMGFITGLMGRVPGSRLLTYMFLIFGGSVAGLRFVIPLGFDLIYPILFVLKAQYEILLALVFWNLANDLFNTRQSKRLFPLITAGGVLGGVIGSFATPFLAKVLTLDNLMFAYLGISMMGAMAVKRMGTRFPTLLLSEKKDKKKGSQASIINEIKKVLPLIRESKLLKVLIMITLMPNVVIPIMNYQFNFAIDQTFATEGGMLTFFGYFRGVLNIINLIILLFIGRIYGRWGLPVALMFHPFNYALAFIAFLLRFDLFSAMYARISTNVLRTTINNPARAVLMGLFPQSSRAVILPFLRGTVVRIGILAGSGFIMLSEGFVHPRYLSLVAVLFAGGWIAATIILKRGYSKILSDLISRDMLDLKSMEEEDVGHVFKDKKIQSQLIHALSSARGDDCLWYAHLLQSLHVENFDTHILSVLNKQDEKTTIDLLPLISSDAGREAIQVLTELRNHKRPNLMVAIIQTATRLAPEISSGFNTEVYATSQYPEVKAYALIGLYNQAPHKHKQVIDSWLDSNDESERKAGIIAAGGSGDGSYIPRLKKMLDTERDGSVLPLVFNSLHHLRAQDLNALVLPYLSHPLESVRLAACEAFEIHNDETLRKMISLMGDSSEEVHQLAKNMIETAPYENGQLLVESLSIPQRRIREGIFDLLKILNIKDLDAFRFARSQIEGNYLYLAEAEGLQTFPQDPRRDLLKDHLDQKRLVQIENTLRVLAAQDRSGQMRIIWRGIFSSDARQRANSLEALDELMDASLSKIMIPLLEDSPPSQRLAVGRRNFQIPDFTSDKSVLYSCLLDKKDCVTVILTLYIAEGLGLERIDRDTVLELTRSENTHIRQMAQYIMDQQEGHPGKKEDSMEKEITIPDKILLLRGIEIFEALSVSELAAVASVTEEIVCPPGEIVIKEGETGETMYLIIKGEVSVIKDQGQNHEIELDRISSGDYFGEMALFEDVLRSATIRTEQESRLLVLHKQEFKEIVREYPQIALNICKVLSGRIRKLHKKLIA
jgi:ATP/ADP translocase